MVRNDSLRPARAVAVYGDWRAIRDLVKNLRDQPVTLRVGPDAVPRVTPAEPAP